MAAAFALDSNTCIETELAKGVSIEEGNASIARINQIRKAVDELADQYKIALDASIEPGAVSKSWAKKQIDAEVSRMNDRICKSISDSGIETISTELNGFSEKTKIEIIKWALDANTNVAKPPQPIIRIISKRPSINKNLNHISQEMGVVQVKSTFKFHSVFFGYQYTL